MGSIGAAGMVLVSCGWVGLLMGILAFVSMPLKPPGVVSVVACAMVTGLPLTYELVVFDPEVGIIIGCNSGGCECELEV